ncbi:MAG: hypothetical protein JNK76_26890 [Planctomycetales bacterium]|nr:hypothetical protein [Planctomycetales bacterium]
MDAAKQAADAVPVILLGIDIAGLHDFYASSLRTPLFTGFFTLSGFLLSMKTFIVINLKKEVYDSSTYRDRIIRKRKLFPDTRMYGPLKNTSRLIFYAILCAVATSTLQLTLGLVKSDYAAFVCITAAFITLCVLVAVLFVIGYVIRQWMIFIEDESRRPADGDNPPETPVADSGPPTPPRSPTVSNDVLD